MAKEKQDRQIERCQRERQTIETWTDALMTEEIDIRHIAR